MDARLTLELAEFAGDWTLSRRIEDHAAGQVAGFEGRARFEVEGAGLAYSETGMLRLPGKAPIRAERRYLWMKDGAQIVVFFDDGRFFHRFDPAISRPEAVHLCDPDHYAVRYDFAGFPAWSSRWRVNGPRKDYTMTSRYRR